MRGHIVKKGSRYYGVIELGHQPALRCETCGKKAGWASEVKLAECSKCSGSLVERSERRQKWLAGHDRKRDAQSALSSIVAETDRSGTYLEPSKQKLGEYLVETWLPAIRSTVRPNTWTSYSQSVRAHIVPALGSIELRHLRPSDLNKLYSELLDRGLSASTVLHTHVILHRALRDATRWGLVSRNVSELADPPKPSRPEMSVWSGAQMASFLAATKDDRHHALYTVACTTGLRRGELLGLRWQDVDLDAARISVRQTLVSNNYQIQFGRPKTAKSTRRISLDAHTVSVLRAWRRAQLEERLAWGAAYQDLDLVFAREDGSPHHPQLLTKRFALDARRAGLPVIRLHDLRHSYATLALASGEHVKVVSERLGHSNIGTTLTTYAHVLPSMEEESAGRVASLIFGS